MTVRQRFTLTHEIAHTLFFRGGPGIPKRMPGALRKSRLEILCNFAAGHLLMPVLSIRAFLPVTGRLSSCEEAAEMCARFAVSPEALLRHISACDLIESETAVLSGESEPGTLSSVILAGAYSMGLHRYVQRPRAYSSADKLLERYLKPAFWASDACECRVDIPGSSGSETAALYFVKRPWPRRKGTFFLEIRLHTETDPLVGL